MKITVYLLMLGACPFLASAQVASPQKRMESLDLARALLTAEPVQVDPNDILYKNPFDRTKPIVKVDEEKPAPVPVVGLSDRDILRAVVNTVLPTGTMALGDTQFLLFGQKKLKVGDTIPIVFQGKTHELEISGVERTSFTLRLNKEEITRPIKPVNKP